VSALANRFDGLAIFKPLSFDWWAVSIQKMTLVTRHAPSQIRVSNLDREMAIECVDTVFVDIYEN